MNNTPVFKVALRADLEKDNLTQFLPKQGEELSTGYDVRAAPKDRNPIIIKPNEYFMIPLGFRAMPENGWYYQLHPRSSSFVKKKMQNLIGIIDESWEGETLFAGKYSPPEGSEDLIINFGDPIAQIIPVKREIVQFTQISNQELDDAYSQRGALRKDGGFGSTDKKK